MTNKNKNEDKSNTIFSQFASTWPSNWRWILETMPSIGLVNWMHLLRMAEETRYASFKPRPLDSATFYRRTTVTSRRDLMKMKMKDVLEEYSWVWRIRRIFPGSGWFPGTHIFLFRSSLAKVERSKALLTKNQNRMDQITIRQKRSRSERMMRPRPLPDWPHPLLAPPPFPTHCCPLILNFHEQRHNTHLTDVIFADKMPGKTVELRLKKVFEVPWELTAPVIYVLCINWSK